MSFLSESEKARVQDAIRQAEAGTRAEIVTVIARASDGYRYIPTLWAALIALAVPGVFYLWQMLAHQGWTTPDADAQAWSLIYPVQVLTFLGLGMLFQIPACRLWLVPARVKHSRAARHAREQFFLQNLHLTEERTGLLIFVSLAEHHVEIIVDEGIASVVDNAEWQETINVFVGHIRKGEVAMGFEHTIEHCKHVLWEHFPHDGRNPDELPNHLIEV